NSGARSSTPRIWNQGKAAQATGKRRSAIVYTADLESRQSGAGEREERENDRLHRGFGIKAKQGGATDRLGDGTSTPRIWNQGKAGRAGCRRRRRIVYTADLESRQSTWAYWEDGERDRLHRGFGIKAKRRRRWHSIRRGSSTPRIWNQGKAVLGSA